MTVVYLFDVDNTLVDFMKMKRNAISAAVDGMIDAGLRLPREAVRERTMAALAPGQLYAINWKTSDGKYGYAWANAV